MEDYSDQGIPVERSATKVPPPEVMEQFRTQVDRYERLLNDAGAILHPVTMQGSLDPDIRPMEEPYHDYHSLVLRLTNLNDGFGGLIQAVRL